MDIKQIPVDAGTIVSSIEKGAFLTVHGDGQRNTMAIGWGMVGICWRKPVAMVAVRNSRHTYSLLETADDFTISMPDGNLRDEIFYCGTKSGREVDKFKECGLTARPGRVTASPIIDTPGQHLECRVIYKNAMEPEMLAEAQHALYPEKDWHTLYFGEILECYMLR